MSTDTHTKIREEVERRLAIARPALCDEPWKADAEESGWTVFTIIDDIEAAIASGLSPTDAMYIALHEPTDAIKRYKYALRVLRRHPPCTDDACAGGDCHRCGEFMPCEPIRDLAESLGIDTGGQP